MEPGDETLEFRGPCGGFEYYPNSIDYLVLVAAGTGASPAVQLARCIQVMIGDLTLNYSALFI
jgi:NAD(P)H-flavin reductase